MFSCHCDTFGAKKQQLCELRPSKRGIIPFQTGVNTLEVTEIPVGQGSYSQDSTFPCDNEKNEEKKTEWLSD